MAGLTFLCAPLREAKAQLPPSEGVPLIDDGALLRVPVTVSGSEKYFVVDTGASITCLDTRYKNELGSPLGESRLRIATGALVNAPTYRAPALNVGGVPLEIDAVACVDLSLQRMIIGHDCDGILGIDALGSHVAVLDLPRNRFSLVASVAASTKAQAKTVPLRCVDGHFYALATANRTDPSWLLIDTGSNITVSLNATLWDEAMSPVSGAEAETT